MAKFQPIPYTTGDLGPGHAIGSNDILTAPNDGANYTGDAGGNFLGDAVGGRDRITGASSNTGTQIITGDAFGNILSKYAVGSRDVLIGGDATDANTHVNEIYGDFHGTMFAKSLGGDDTITGGVGVQGISTQGPFVGTTGTYDASNLLVGDAHDMTDKARGGADEITGAAKGAFPAATGSNVLIGDAINASGTARAGRDVLTSGTGVDHMWGDFVNISGSTVQGRPDIFKFLASSGHDTIEDFGQNGGHNLGRDNIAVSLTGIHTFRQFTAAGGSIGAFTADATGGTQLVSFDTTGNNDVLVHSEVALTYVDFLFR